MARVGCCETADGPPGTAVPGRFLCAREIVSLRRRSARGSMGAARTPGNRHNRQPFFLQIDRVDDRLADRSVVDLQAGADRLGIGRVDRQRHADVPLHRLDQPADVFDPLFGPRRNLVDAAVEFQRALELEPSLVASRVGLGAIYLRQGELGRAIEQLERAAELDPKDGTAHFYLALAYQNGNLPEKAIAAFEKSRELTPDDITRNRIQVYLAALKPDGSTDAERR